ncbi:MAG TPA: hypothetical protein VJV79_27535, partial [Polyangiaceae bacterium]|nr:hypothetical protein [Polyangiaceae bacterium]
LVLKDIWVQTPRDELRGALFLGNSSASGAFLVKRGKLNLGLELRPGALDVNLRADPAWLARSLGELESANVP